MPLDFLELNAIWGHVSIHFLDVEMLLSCASFLLLSWPSGPMPVVELPLVEGWYRIRSLGGVFGAV